MRNKLASLFLVLNLLVLTQVAPAADFAKGFDAYSAGDYDTALAEWKPLAEAGDANGQFGLGLLYSNGWGVEQDDALALKWYELAANQGHAEAQYNLGVMYMNGWGVEQDDALAFKWTQMAAEGGFADAHRALGKMYNSGIGVAADKVQAYRWFDSGHALGDSQSGNSRDELGTEMPPADVAVAREQAKTWLEEFMAKHPDTVLPDEPI
jgi:TPR repeat protein